MFRACHLKGLTHITLLIINLANI
uniref:Uncharacterized protein n=1 Tax=Anguilla anguilla TaxID=7936 RepID=A0A0E9P6S5_ANGAN